MSPSDSRKPKWRDGLRPAFYTAAWSLAAGLIALVTYPGDLPESLGHALLRVTAVAALASAAVLALYAAGILRPSTRSGPRFVATATPRPYTYWLLGFMVVALTLAIATECRAS
jgi:hypothetical protein